MKLSVHANEELKETSKRASCVLLLCNFGVGVEMAL